MRLNLSKRIAGTIALCACFGLWNALRCAFKAEDSLEGDSDWDLDKEFRRYCDMGCLVQSAEINVSNTHFAFLSTGESIKLEYYGRARQVSEVIKHGIQTPLAEASGADHTIFLDIGGNLGYFTLLAAKSGADAVHYFEPQPICVHVATNSMRLNGLKSVINVHHNGVSVTPTEFKVCADGCLGGFTYDSNNLKPHVDPNYMAKCDNVRTTSLEPAMRSDRAKFAGPKKYVVKIDTEGSEIAVLRTILNVINSNNAVFTDFVIEIAPHAWVKKLLTLEDGIETIEKLMNHGYRAYSLDIGLCVPEDKNLITEVKPPAWLSAPLYKISNMKKFILERAAVKCGTDLWFTNYWTSSGPPLRAYSLK